MYAQQLTSDYQVNAAVQQALVFEPPYENESFACAVEDVLSGVYGYTLD